MDKQYSVKFFTSLVECMQKVCRDFLDFEQAVDLSGYLCVEIDNFKKERYVISELIQNTGDVISESYCTKAFKTLRKLPRETTCSSGIENSDPRQSSVMSIGSTAGSTGLGRISARRSQCSSGRTSQSTSQTDSSWNSNPADSRYQLSSVHVAGLKRTIPQSSLLPSVKRDRSESYSSGLESEEYSTVDAQHASTNTYLTEQVSGSATCTSSAPNSNSNACISGSSMTLPSCSISNSSTAQTLSSVGESIRLPLNVTVKEEDDIAFMVLDDSQDFDSSATYGDNDSSNTFAHAQSVNNETLPLSSPNFGDQENAHTARKMKGHVKLFQDFSSEDESLENNSSTNTVNKTRSDLRVFTDWLKSNKEFRNLEDIPPAEFDGLLAQFYMDVRAKDGSEYEANTIIGIRNSIHRHLRNLKVNMYIKKDPEFSHSRNVLELKKTQLKNEPRQKKQHRRKVDGLCEDDISILYDKQVLGAANPASLLHAVWMNNAFYFGFRGRKDHVNLLWGDIELKTDPLGKEFLEYTERNSKARSGCKQENNRKCIRSRNMITRIHSKPDSPHCPIKMYKQYRLHRPSRMRDPNTRFYLHPLENPPSQMWYTHHVLGKNKLGEMMKNIIEQGNTVKTEKE
ncbi:uncharacterized protein LOC121383525 [Gigantopelta aegis]|uniref:uncharacterized protein LOC121383525 n=1 Tax=Gigantopelta aegis TaxID=1735272 RepID=UPI001B88AFB6|nr:uncharacterized protein LOC121383525 [Gigantopelta aegis]